MKSYALICTFVIKFIGSKNIIVPQYVLYLIYAMQSFETQSEKTRVLILVVTDIFPIPLFLFCSDSLSFLYPGPLLYQYQYYITSILRTVIRSFWLLPCFGKHLQPLFSRSNREDDFTVLRLDCEALFLFLIVVSIDHIPLNISLEKV